MQMIPNLRKIEIQEGHRDAEVVEMFYGKPLWNFEDMPVAKNVKMKSNNSTQLRFKRRIVSDEEMEQACEMYATRNMDEISEELNINKIQLRAALYERYPERFKKKHKSERRKSYAEIQATDTI